MHRTRAALTWASPRLLDVPHGPCGVWVVVHCLRGVRRDRPAVHVGYGVRLGPEFSADRPPTQPCLGVYLHVVQVQRGLLALGDLALTVVYFRSFRDVKLAPAMKIIIVRYALRQLTWRSGKW